MARPREHDPAAVTNGLIAAFSAGGYEGTSFSDLEAATGLDRAQLSRTYGDKKQLFLIAVDAIAEARFAEYLRPLSEQGGVREIRRMMLAICDMAGTPQGRLGCLVCNTCREPIATTDPEVAALVDKHFRRVENAFAGALRNAVASGDLSMSSAQVRRAARHLYAVHVSLMVLLRAGEPRPVLRDIALQAMTTLVTTN
jgi:TetR/AcrR family transcriptional repressor of nem operon